MATANTTPSRSSTTTSIKDTWRLELFYKTRTELQQCAAFLAAHGIRRVNLTNKHATDDLLTDIALLKDHIPGIDVCAHFSIKYNYTRAGPAACTERLAAFLASARHELPSSSHVLLVSGGGKRRAYDTVAALQALQHHHTTSPCAVPTTANQPPASQPPSTPSIEASSTTTGPPATTNPTADRTPEPPNTTDPTPHTPTPPLDPLHDLAVAFNPYHPVPTARKDELARLSAKLATGRVTRIYLQMGTDLALLRQGLGHLQHLTAKHAATTGQPPPQLYGSVFLPSKRLLAQMRFRPWNGVYLSEAYLSGVEAAERVTRALLGVYREWEVVPLVESRVGKVEELRHLLRLLGVEEEAPAAVAASR